MKYVVLIPDGAADYPIEQLGGKTPLQAADMPNISKLVCLSTLGLASTIPDGFSPGSDVANLSILGYDPALYYSGRGPLEAAYNGVELEENDTAFRCNLITVEDGRLVDYSASHISTEDAAALIRLLDKNLGSDVNRFYPGISYRHLAVFKHIQFEGIKTIAPHDAIGEPIDSLWPKGENADLLINLTKESQALLSNQPFNIERKKQGLNPANMIWLWGGGQKKEIPSFFKRFGLKGGVVSAVDLIKGLAVSMRLSPVNIAGATGYFDTDYEAKAKEALNVLKKDDFVYIHVEAPDEAGHTGNIEEKVKALENFDKRLVKILLEELDLEQTKILLLPDHATPISIRTHTSDAVPFMLYPGNGGAKSFDEQSAAEASSEVIEGHKLMEKFI